jgi:MFS family permease
MALSDLVTPLVIIPRVIENTVQASNAWNVKGNAGEALCKLFTFTADLSPAVSILSLICITADRFCAIVFPLRAGVTRLARARMFVIAGTWILPALILSPYFYGFILKTNPSGQLECSLEWSKDTDEHLQVQIAYTTVICVFFIIVPFIVLVVMYSLILVRLWRQDRGAMALSQSVRERVMRYQKTKKVIYMALSIVMVFGICWGPYNAVVFALTFVWEWQRHPSFCGFDTFMFVAQFMTYSNPAFNPLIYFIFIERFRKGLRRIITCTGKSNSKGGMSSGRAFSDTGHRMTENPSVPLTLIPTRSVSRELARVPTQLLKPQQL